MEDTGEAIIITEADIAGDIAIMVAITEAPAVEIMAAPAAAVLVGVADIAAVGVVEAAAMAAVEVEEDDKIPHPQRGLLPGPFGDVHNLPTAKNH